MVKSTGCSSTELGFDPHHPYNGSQLSVTLILEDPMPSSGTRHSSGVQTHLQAKYPNTLNNKIKNATALAGVLTKVWRTKEASIIH